MCVDVLDLEACIFALGETTAIFQTHCFLFQINPGVDLGVEGLEVMQTETSLRKRREFPSGPVVKTPYVHCRGLGFNPWLWN